MGLADFLERADATDRQLVVLNRTAPRPIQNILEDLFADQPVSVEERQLPAGESDLVLLLDGDDVVATSPVQALADAILMVNSDLYITGARDLDELALPAVVEGLADVRFSLRGYPESNKEKLLLITVSRYIESLAWEAGTGTLRSAFQELSRIDDEIGTRRVYDRLAETEVTVHVYGRPDWIPPARLDPVIHAGYGGDFRDAWFVIFQPEAGGRAAALLAIETEPRRWEGFWTFDPELTADVAGYVEQHL